MGNEIGDLIEAATACMQAVESNLALRNQRSGARELASNLQRALSALVEAVEKGQRFDVFTTEPMNGDVAHIDMDVLMPAIREARRMDMVALIAMSGWRKKS